MTIASPLTVARLIGRCLTAPTLIVAAAVLIIAATITLTLGAVLAIVAEGIARITRHLTTGALALLKRT